MILKHEEPHTEERKRLDYQTGSERAIAEQAKSYLDTEEIDALSEEMEQVSHKVQFDGKKLTLYGYFMCVLLLVYNALLILLPVSWKVYLTGWEATLTIFAIALSPLLIIRDNGNGQRVEQVLETFTRSNDLRVIAPLAGCLRYVNGPLRQKMTATLTSLLSQLQVTDANFFTPLQQSHLYTMLNGEDNTKSIPLQIAVLKAYEKFGDTAALPYVQHLAEITPKTSEGRELQTVAQSCLNALRERAQQEQNERTLLRPSDSDQTSDVLLRPAMANLETKPKELLRPAGKASEQGTNV